PVIVYGVFEPLLEDSDSIYAYRRHLDGRTVTVACNWTDQTQPCSLFDAFDKNPVGAQELISNYSSHKAGALQPYEARVLLEE
ncbi:MAG TPA: glucohydrolase, partial [Lachnospiraceae bacterium]|nr:glucohydrolase [Lachnospiraceae bacterium]